MATNVFSKLKTQAGDVERSSQWYQTQIRKLGRINTTQLMREGKLVNQIIPGEMYLFAYDPKLKDKLPFYDMFPLVLPFRKIGGGFVGLNLHYLPYLMRFRILGFLSDYTNNEKMDETTRLSFSWRILEGASRLSPARACVRKYLSEHVQTRFLRIPFPDWVVASQLPVEKFEGASKDEVWRETRKKY